MKKLIILLAMLIITGCSEKWKLGWKEEQKQEVQNWTDYQNGYKIKIIDSCEYIKTGVYGGEVLTHKGNCKNPIHKGQR